MTTPLGFVLPAIALGSGPLLFRPNQRGFFPFNSKGGALTPIVAQATLEEIHEDELEITEHPVEVGAAISDHAYKRPRRVVIRCAWSNSPSPPSSIISQAVGAAASLFGTPVRILAGVAATIPAITSLFSGNAPNQIRSIYDQLLALQTAAIPFNILTAKQSYKNMLFQSIRVETNAASENSLPIVLICREVIIVSTQVVTLDTGAQAFPDATAPPQEQGNQTQQPAPTAVPDTGTVSGALTGAQVSASQLTPMLEQQAAFVQSAQGALAQLPGVISTTVDSLNKVLAELPAALEIPTIPSAQTLTIALGSPDLGADFSLDMSELPGVLADAQTTLTAAAKQLPALTLPSELSGLSAAIGVVQQQITNSLSQLERANVI